MLEITIITLVILLVVSTAFIFYSLGAVNARLKVFNILERELKRLDPKKKSMSDKMEIIGIIIDEL